MAVGDFRGCRPLWIAEGQRILGSPTPLDRWREAYLWGWRTSRSNEISVLVSEVNRGQKAEAVWQELVLTSLRGTDPAL